MGANQVQIRRDTASNLAATTPANAELAYDTTNKRLNIGDGATAGGIPSPNFYDVQKNTYTYVTATGTANALTLTLANAPASYSAGQIFRFKAALNNSGATTIDVNGLGTKNIYKLASGSLGELEADDIVQDVVYAVVYDGTQFQLMGAGLGGGQAGLELIAVASASASATVDFTGLFTSDYDDYVMICDRVVPATNATYLCVRVRFTGGGSYDATNYLYSNVYFTSSDTFDTGSLTAQMRISPPVSNNTNYGYSCVIEIFGMGQNDSLRSTFRTSGVNPKVSSALPENFSGCGLRESFTAQDSVQFLMSSGNITSGNFYLYGRRNVV